MLTAQSVKLNSKYFDEIFNIDVLSIYHEA